MSSAANLLGAERSPYLLQHADNPVHWRPWGQAALDAARAANKPILLSIGYAACHWCHVMAHESFEDAATAAEMNEAFINVKVDREERPDIDHTYMSAIQAMGKQGGWPLTMFITPDGVPFWGGTYFPPTPRHGMPSFRQVLAAVRDAWAQGHESIAQNAKQMSAALAKMAASHPGPLPSPHMLGRVAASYIGMIDHSYGGLRGAPKFPNPPIFRFLWQEGARGEAAPAIEATHALLVAMSQGGIYDHLGGGYARYATDVEWLVPHFEKMLYDNAQILELLALAQAHRPDPLYAQRAEETVGWLMRDMMTGPEADPRVFAASEDADSEGEEGKFYVWTEAEIDALLGPGRAPAFKAAYDVTQAGNWEGHTILRRVTPPGDGAAETLLASSRTILFEARCGRIRPGRDDKVLADWNGLMIAALARASSVFGRLDWLELGQDCYEQLRGLLDGPDGRIQHAWRDGVVTAAGLLDDQACMARAALALFEASGQDRYLTEAIGLVRAAQAHFADADGSLFTSADDALDVPPPRPRTASDNATPAGQAVTAEVLARLCLLTGDPAWGAACEALICANSGGNERLSGVPGILAATRLLADGATVVVTGPAEDAADLVAVALASADPTVAVLRAPPGSALPADHPAFGKPTGDVAAYLCRARVCGVPIRSPIALLEALAVLPEAR